MLTHGAGGNAESPVLVEVAAAFAAAGFTVLRCDLPFRQTRRTGPPSPARAERDRAGLRSAVGALRRRAKGRIVLGGHSYGGRQASMLAAEAPDTADALLLLSYPLHPPNWPRRRRTAHFPALRTPAVFLHGTRDPFAGIAALRAALRLIPAPTALVVARGAPHDLTAGPGGRAAVAALAAEAVRAVRTLLR